MLLGDSFEIDAEPGELRIDDGVLDSPTKEDKGSVEDVCAESRIKQDGGGFYAGAGSTLPEKEYTTKHKEEGTEDVKNGDDKNVKNEDVNENVKLEEKNFRADVKDEVDLTAGIIAMNNELMIF